MNQSIAETTFSDVGQKMIEAVETYIQTMNWRYEKITSQPTRVGYKMSFKMRNGSYRMFFDLTPDQYSLAIYCYSPVDIPIEAIPAVSDFVNRVNFNIYHGKLELNMDDGTVRYSCAVCLEDSPLTPGIISYMENSAAFGMDDHFPSLMTIVHGGKKPKQVFEDLMNEEITESIKENVTTKSLH
jgi:hypothetical protein